MADDDFNSFKTNQRENDSDSEPSLPLRLDLLDDSHSHTVEEHRLGNQNSGPSGKNFNNLNFTFNILLKRLNDLNHRSV